MTEPDPCEPPATGSGDPASPAGPAPPVRSGMFLLELVPVPVSAIDRAKAYYSASGFISADPAAIWAVITVPQQFRHLQAWWLPTAGSALGGAVLRSAVSGATPFANATKRCPLMHVERAAG
jgi:hypothetical protein